MKNYQRFLIVLMGALLLQGMMSCHTAKPESTARIDRKWMLIGMPGYAKEQLVSKKAYLDMSPQKGKNGQYPAFAGCNHMMVMGNFSPKGTATVRNISSTFMACPDNGEVEYKFAAILKEAKTYTLHGQYLIIHTTKGQDLSFVAEDWD